MNDKINKTLNNLKKRTFSPYYYETAEEAIEKVFELIPKDAKVGIGGSMTITNMDIPNLLKNRGNQVLMAGYTDLPKEQIYRQAAFADVYMTSANAITCDGEIVNIDGRGNRVAATIYGPPVVIAVVGVNKITDSLEDAIKRARNVASPQNCVRLNKKTPCAITGKCSYCYPPETICRNTVITHFPSSGKQYYVILVNQELGY
ncbi:MAG TPA: lactate utilization protein [Clostridiales bacterium]|nr:lactate utilization protein [Clostridiales bacterium]